MTSYPKPDGSKVTRHAPVFGWTNLPGAGRQGDPPALPAWRVWHPATLVWWAEAWATPQATMWTQSGASMHPLAMLYDDLISGRVPVVKLSSEIRQHEDRHGLSGPKAMLQLRWRIDEEKSAVRPKPKVTARERRLRMRAVK